MRTKPYVSAREDPGRGPLSVQALNVRGRGSAANGRVWQSSRCPGSPSSQLPQIQQKRRPGLVASPVTDDMHQPLVRFVKMCGECNRPKRPILLRP